jgi:cytosine/adenosine deaminase-related metal-dependent hydrolase
MRLASGIAPVKAYRDAGVNVGIGVDGSASSDASHLLLEVRQAMYLARLKMALRPPEGPMTVLPTSHPLRRDEWVTARDAIEIGTRGGAAVLGRDDIGHLAPGMCADFFSVNLNTIDLAGAMADPVAALIFCAPQTATYTVVNGEVIVQDGQIATVDMDPLLEEHQHHAQQLLTGE